MVPFNPLLNHGRHFASYLVTALYDLLRALSCGAKLVKSLVSLAVRFTIRVMFCATITWSLWHTQCCVTATTDRFYDHTLHRTSTYSP